MKDILDWLLHDDQERLYEFVFALVLNLLFLALIGLMLWPLGKLAFALALTKGYAIFWLAIWVMALLSGFLMRVFRVSMYDHSTIYLAAGLAIGGYLQMGWSAFAALLVRSFVAEAPFWVAAILYLIGALSCLIALYAVSAAYYGTFYKLVNLGLSLTSFVLFSLWPGIGNVLYGWFLRLF